MEVAPKGSVLMVFITWQAMFGNGYLITIPVLITVGHLMKIRKVTLKTKQTYLYGLLARPVFTTNMHYEEDIMAMEQNI